MTAPQEDYYTVLSLIRPKLEYAGNSRSSSQTPVTNPEYSETRD
jgi:hypothetical protein